MQDACIIFPKSSPDSHKLEATISAFESAGVDVPPAFRIIFYKGKALDLVRYKQVTELTTWLTIKHGILSTLDSIDHLDLLVIAESTTEKSLHQLAASYVKSEGESKMLEDIGRLTYGLISHENGFHADMHDDLTRVSFVCGFNDPPFSERRKAFDELEQKKRNASYTGVLASFLGDDRCWLALAAVAGSNASPVQDSHN